MVLGMPGERDIPVPSTILTKSLMSSGKPGEWIQVIRRPFEKLISIGLDAIRYIHAESMQYSILAFIVCFTKASWNQHLLYQLSCAGIRVVYKGMDMENWPLR
jgi:hypothetical protein